MKSDSTPPLPPFSVRGMFGPTCGLDSSAVRIPVMAVPPRPETPTAETAPAIVSAPSALAASADA
jgi:hypothetical protein